MTPMIDFDPIGTENEDKPFFPDVPPGRRVAVVLTILLILATIGAWFIFLGWGVVEITHSAFLGIKTLWSEIL
ncbi:MULTISPECIES: hypothetical protein [unclassified Bradyrhizobium]|uniref:hypothetical protein n=2 Tax=unclassified Bradyrhizobium TaxID=2631580 RepID=UPI0028E50E07|nr:MULTISPECIES: hypothetical protein [unclassified Bradyrhizobium]